MDKTERNRQQLRRGIERLVRTSLADEEHWVDDLSFWPQQGGGWKPAVGITTVNKEPPPLDTTRQLALSVLLGEPVPTQVLLAAMEEAGMFPGGVYQAVAEEREKIVFPVAEYPAGDSAQADYDFCDARRELLLDPISRRLMNEAAYLCLEAVGRKDVGVTRMVNRFVESWVAPFGPVVHPSGRTLHISPTAEFMRRQVQNMPSLRRILAHLKPTATPRTAAVITRLLAHLDSVPARNVGG